MLMSNGLPAVPVHDLVIHPRDKDLVVGTHGRSIFIANVEHIQLLDKKVLSEEVYAFNIEKIYYRSNWGSQSWSRWYGYFEPEISLPFYSKVAGKAIVKVKSKDGLELNTFEIETLKGLNYGKYDLTLNEKSIKKFSKKHDREVKKADNGKYYLLPGDYTIEFIVNGKSSSQNLVVKE